MDHCFLKISLLLQHKQWCHVMCESVCNEYMYWLLFLDELPAQKCCVSLGIVQYYDYSTATVCCTVLTLKPGIKGDLFICQQSIKTFVCSNT